MCELFGVSSIRTIHLNGLLEEFFSHGREHPHGWGMAFFNAYGVALEKEPSPSFKSLYLKHRLTVPIDTAAFIAHIRLATKGSLEYQNTHPFVRKDKTGRTWTLAHNGTIFDCDILNKYVRSQSGSTDSERILMYIVDRINAAISKKIDKTIDITLDQTIDETLNDKSNKTASLQHGSNAPPSTKDATCESSELTAGERFAVVDSVIHEITPENKVNLLLYDGELLYAHTNYKDSLHYSQRDGGVILSTRPLSTLRWSKVPMNTLLAFKEGRVEYTGVPHKNEFFDSEEKMRLLFIDYSSL